MMIISKKQMQIIVEEMEKTIHRHINIIDKSGCIIASTNPERIGTLHTAALVLMGNRMDRLSIQDDCDYEGAKQGVNLPITINGEVVGVVGITGKSEEVHEFGTIIQKMTEILIADAYHKEQSLLYDNAKNSFIYRWLFEDTGDPDMMGQMELSGQLLGIDITLPRIAVVLKPLPEPSKAQDALAVQYLQSGLNQIVTRVTDSHPAHVQLTMGSQLLLLCHSTQYQAVNVLCSQISNAFRDKHHTPLAAGIGTLGCSRQEIIKSYREAERACFLSIHTRGNEIKQYTESDLSLLLQKLPREYQEKYIRQIFPRCTDEEMMQWMLLLRIFFDTDGSIQSAANQLYIHKNTMQYRLNKLKQATGYDVRIYKGAFPLYAALILYESIHIDKK